MLVYCPPIMVKDPRLLSKNKVLKAGIVTHRLGHCLCCQHSISKYLFESHLIYIQFSSLPVNAPGTIAQDCPTLWFPNKHIKYLDKAPGLKVDLSQPLWTSRELRHNLCLKFLSYLRGKERKQETETENCYLLSAS